MNKLTVDELMEYGLEVFNHEEDKFQRWLKKSNLSLGSVTPESLLNTPEGIEQVRLILGRIEHGNLS